MTTKPERSLWCIFGWWLALLALRLCGLRLGLRGRFGGTCFPYDLDRPNEIEWVCFGLVHVRVAHSRTTGESKKLINYWLFCQEGGWDTLLRQDWRLEGLNSLQLSLSKQPQGL